LYDGKRFALGEARELSPKDRKYLAEEDFDFWFESAGEFYEQFEWAFHKEKLILAAFSLHQVVERLYNATLLVFTRYKPKTHDIIKLSRLVSAQEPRFLLAFPKGSEIEKRRLELLRRAYVDARYKKSYAITREELLWLEERVKILRALTKKYCLEKIESFAAP